MYMYLFKVIFNILYTGLYPWSITKLSISTVTLIMVGHTVLRFTLNLLIKFALNESAKTVQDFVLIGDKTPVHILVHVQSHRFITFSRNWQKFIIMT